jgi:hypothetical protein
MSKLVEQLIAGQKQMEQSGLPSNYHSIKPLVLEEAEYLVAGMESIRQAYLNGCCDKSQTGIVLGLIAQMVDRADRYTSGNIIGIRADLFSSLKQSVPDDIWKSAF